MSGRDPLLVWYTDDDRILDVAECDRMLERWRRHPDAMVSESRAFWTAITKRACRRWRKGVVTGGC